MASRSADDVTTCGFGSASSSVPHAGTEPLPYVNAPSSTSAPAGWSTCTATVDGPPAGTTARNSLADTFMNPPHTMPPTRIPVASLKCCPNTVIVAPPSTLTVVGETDCARAGSKVKPPFSTASPAAVVTVTAAGPARPCGVTARIVDCVSTSNDDEGTPAKRTDVAVRNRSPYRYTVVPPRYEPDEGSTALRPAGHGPQLDKTIATSAPFTWPSPVRSAPQSTQAPQSDRTCARSAPLTASSAISITLPGHCAQAGCASAAVSMRVQRGGDAMVECS